MESFEDFVMARGAALWRSAWLLTGDAGRAEDLVQTALSKSWRHHARVAAGGGSFEAYVRRAMVTTYTSWWRRKRPVEDLVGGILDHSGATLSDALDAQLDVLSALKKLPPQQRAVVVLRYYEDLTELETARALNCSVGTVKQHHSRAIKALRKSPLLAPKGEVERA